MLHLVRPRLTRGAAGATTLGLAAGVAVVGLASGVGWTAAAGSGEPWRVTTYAGANGSGGRDAEAGVRHGTEGASITLVGDTVTAGSTLTAPVAYAVTYQHGDGWAQLAAGPLDRAQAVVRRLDLAPGTVVRLEICADAARRHCATELGQL